MRNDVAQTTRGLPAMDDATQTTQSRSAWAAQDKLLAERENILAEELRDVCVEDEAMRKMKERNPKQSSEIIHQLGRVYRERSPDKIAIIKSAALFNAAIVRKPDNLDEVRADLNELCAHVLHLANVKSESAEFVRQAATIFKQVEKMRSMVKTELDKIGFLSTDLNLKEKSRKSDEIKTLQVKLTQVYINIMREIMEYCIKVKGTAPCQYALIGMGSLARKEITHYSDFESAVLLENGIESKENYEETLEYFRWVAVFFQLVMVNFGETIIRFVAIPSLNNPCNKDEDWFYDAFTPCGICPDGLAPQASKNPLGRQVATKNKPWTTELIKPVSEMLKYLDQEEDVNNGYHLADMLTKTCFVSGEENLHDEFTESVKRKLTDEKLTASFIRQVKEDLLMFNGFACSNTLLGADAFDLKRTIYRSITLSLTALARLYRLEWSSSFDIIEQIKEKGLSQLYDVFGCKYALSKALEVRLRVYTKNEGQVDKVGCTSQDLDAQRLYPVMEHLSAEDLAEVNLPTVFLQVFVIITLKEAEENQAEARAAKLNEKPTSSKEEIEEEETVESRRPQTRASDTAGDVLSMTCATTRAQHEAFDAYVKCLSCVKDFKRHVIGDEICNIGWEDKDSNRLEIDRFLKGIFEMCSVNLFGKIQPMVQNVLRAILLPSDNYEHSLIAQLVTRPSDQWTSSEYDSIFEQFLSIFGGFDLENVQYFTAFMKMDSQSWKVGPNGAGSVLESLVRANVLHHSENSILSSDICMRTIELVLRRWLMMGYSVLPEQSNQETLDYIKKIFKSTLLLKTPKADEMIEDDLG